MTLAHPIGSDQGEPAAPPIGPTSRTFPGARRPDRSRWVDAAGVRLATYEWGDPQAPVIFTAHGGFDFAGTYDVFAPMLADAGYRVVSWDARGHGWSDHTVLYSWSADMRDGAVVLDSCGVDKVVLLGHSKGGGVMLEMAHALPHRITHLINIDGLPAGKRWPDLADHDRTRMMHSEFDGWLDFRRSVARKQRRPGTLEELALRRRQLNPRLPIEWLEYLVTIGAREDRDGWRWRIDASMRLGGFGPWRPEWSTQRLPGIGVPVFGMIGLQPEPMGWGAQPEDIEPNLPPGSEFRVYDDVGHFIHIEQPRRTADAIIDFLARHPLDHSSTVGGWS